MRDSRPPRPTGPGRPRRPHLLTPVPGQPPDDDPPPTQPASQPWTDAEVCEVLYVGLRAGLTIASARIWQPPAQRQAAA